MKKMEKITTETLVCVELRCDMCNSVIDLTKKLDDVTVCGRSRKLTYEGHGTSKTISVDVCFPCLENRIIPWLESQSVIVHKEDNDW